MRSGNGRHRRPRQAPALFVTAGVTGSAIAIPLLGASGASAAETSTWDRVAECESGGTWSANLGNGFYGGLQMSQKTWDEFGGGAYAERPDLASRSQQIAVAEKVLAKQGPAAWLSCAVVSGLTGGGALTPGGDGDDSGSSDAGAGGGATEGSPSPSGSAGSSDGRPGDEPTPSHSPDAPTPGATGSADTEGSDPGSASGSGSETGASKGKHRGNAADESPAESGADKEREVTDRASRDAGYGRDLGAGSEDASTGPGIISGAGLVGPYAPDYSGDFTVRPGAQKVVGGWL